MGKCSSNPYRMLNPICFPNSSICIQAHKGESPTGIAWDILRILMRHNSLPPFQLFHCEQCHGVYLLSYVFIRVWYSWVGRSTLRCMMLVGIQLLFRKYGHRWCEILEVNLNCSFSFRVHVATVVKTGWSLGKEKCGTDGGQQNN